MVRRSDDESVALVEESTGYTKEQLELVKG
jgi:hypothetical protein